MTSRGSSRIATLLLADARLADGRRVDIEITDDTITAIEPVGKPRSGEIETCDCEAALVTPCFVEGHIHLDKTLLGLPLIPHLPGPSVAERIRAEKVLRKNLGLSVEERGGRLIEQIATFGTGVLRTHVDIDTELGLTGLEAVLRLRARYRDLVDMQIVAFPQSGILRDPGTAELLGAALDAGADLVGGLDPAGIDEDIEGHLDAIFGVAEKRGAGVDIHLHDPGPLGAFEMRAIAARTRAAGLASRVTISHAYALGALDEVEFGRTAEALAGAGIAIMTNAPGTGPMPPVLRLAAAGVTVFAGSDNIRDAWWPYGDGDMLDRAQMIGYRQGFFTNPDLEHAFSMSTGLAAKALAIPGYGLAVGCAADVVVIPAASVPEAVLNRPASRTLIKRGKMVSRRGALKSH